MTDKASAAEYKRYQEYFLWTADLAKHVIDFIMDRSHARLSDFRQQFVCWLLDTYPNNAMLSSWLAAYADTDFRRVISRQAVFLYSQALQIDKCYYKCSLWAEVHPRDLTLIPEQVEDLKMQPEVILKDPSRLGVNRRKTTVTPYVMKCFEHLPWATLLHPQAPSVLDSQPLPVFKLSAHQRVQATSSRIAIGDLIAIEPDQTSSWKSLDLEWLALVQGIDETSSDARLSVLWMYRPCDTACMKMTYPHPREVFLSDHCNCGDAPIYLSDVIRKPSLALFTQPGDCVADFFCRQQYREADAAWTTLQHCHLQCSCSVKSKQVCYEPGQTVLFKQKDNLRPAIVIGTDTEDPNEIQIRRLLFRGRDFNEPDVASNELVYTDKITTIKSQRVVRPCSIRVIPTLGVENHKIPFPYNRDGAGDFFYIRCGETEKGKITDFEESWQGGFLQGAQSLDDVAKKPLRPLDLFCGGGNFARGLEEAGAIKCEWAVDYSGEAIHTYHANLPEGGETKLFWGSVNHFLHEALDGTSVNTSIPKKGEVDVIIAGSPCQGFSMANPKRGNVPGLLNESLVASVVSFIDIYRPKYALLENVKGMAMGGEDKNVLAAVLCAVVSMGYQVQTYLLDAWSFGSPQSRSRIFISCVAPELPVPREPNATHSHPSWVKSGGLGRTANGLQTSARNYVPTPLLYVSAQEATRDLPLSDHTLASIRYPDHREAKALSVFDRVRIACIPRFPEGSGFVDACERGLMPRPQVDSFNWSNETRAGELSKVWTRVKPNKLFPTIQTAPRPDDGRSGNVLHWDEHRLLTILEARRAQGFPDQEVVLGSPAVQWKIIGNSVARPVAFALGLALREAWLATPSKSILDRGVCIEQTLFNDDTADGMLSPDIKTLLSSVTEESDDNKWHPRARDAMKSLSTVIVGKAFDLMECHLREAHS